MTNLKIEMSDTLRSIASSKAALVALLLSTTSIGLVPAFAQEAPIEEAVENETTLDPIVITSRRHSEDAQKVPISINVIESKSIEDISPANANQDLARRVPNFNYVNLGSIYSNLANIRGVGSVLALSPDDTSVSYNIDEVPMSAFGIPPTTLDLSRIEVLRGPQGSLYGRNAQGGAINFIPNRPDFIKEFLVRGEIGTNGWHLGELVANTPLIDDVLASRVAVQYSSRDGDIRNIIAGGEDGDTIVSAARASLLWEADADTSALLTVNYGQNKDHLPGWVLRDAPCYPCSGDDPRDEVNRRNFGANLRFEHAFDSFRFTSISSVQQVNVDWLSDQSDSLIYFARYGLPAPPGHVRDGRTRERSYFQEFRLSSLEESPVVWTAGVNFYRTEYSIAYETISPTAPFISGEDDNHVTNSYAAFAEATVPLVGELKGIAGFRLTHERKSADYRYFSDGLGGAIPLHTQDGSFSDTFATGRIGLTYEWTDDFMTFVTVGRGAIAGGFTTTPINTSMGLDEEAFPTSTSWTYEAGFKSTLMDGQATLNASVFYNDVSKGRLMTFNPTLAAFEISALNYETYGAEIEGRIQATSDLTLFGGLGYTHAEMTSVPANDISGSKVGNKLPNVAKFTGTIGAEYRIEADRIGIATGEVYANASYQYVGARAADLQNSFDLKPYGVVNTRIGWQGPKSEIYAFAHNLFDERYETNGAYYGPGAEVVSPGVGRTIGIGAGWKF